MDNEDFGLGMRDNMGPVPEIYFTKDAMGMGMMDWELNTFLGTSPYVSGWVPLSVSTVETYVGVSLVRVWRAYAWVLKIPLVVIVTGICLGVGVCLLLWVHRWIFLWCWRTGLNFLLHNPLLS